MCAVVTTLKLFAYSNAVTALDPILVDRSTI